MLCVQDSKLSQVEKNGGKATGCPLKLTEGKLSQLVAITEVDTMTHTLSPKWLQSISILYPEEVYLTFMCLKNQVLYFVMYKYS